MPLLAVNYYNEFDPNAAAWLKQLIAEGLIPPGKVDQRSITDVQPTDLSGFTQCHFFCGIGGWSLALQLAGWPADRPVWTGSCPCQPFSVAGKGKGADDERHLWPAFFNLIRQCRPERVFGEQVADAIGKGWLDGISADLEGENYACGSVVLGAHSVGAPHIRKRLYWVADAAGQQWDGGRDARRGRGELADSGPTSGVGYPNSHHGEPLRGHSGENPQKPIEYVKDHWANFALLPCGDGKARRVEPGLAALAHGVPCRVVRLRGYGNAIVPQVAANFINAFNQINHYA